MKRASAPIVTAGLIAVLSLMTALTNAQTEDQEKPAPATVTGTSACAACDGDIDGHDVLLYTGEGKDGIRILLKGDGPNYKEAHGVRRDGKKMTAVLTGPMEAKMDKNGDPYLEAQVRNIKIES